MVEVLTRLLLDRTSAYFCLERNVGSCIVLTCDARMAWSCLTMLDRSTKSLGCVCMCGDECSMAFVEQGLHQIAFASGFVPVIV